MIIYKLDNDEELAFAPEDTEQLEHWRRTYGRLMCADGYIPDVHKVDIVQCVVGLMEVDTDQTSDGKRIRGTIATLDLLLTDFGIIRLQQKRALSPKPLPPGLVERFSEDQKRRLFPSYSEWLEDARPKVRQYIEYMSAKCARFPLYPDEVSA